MIVYRFVVARKSWLPSASDSVASRTALGKGVLKALFGEPPTHNPRMFPGHMYYSFDLAAKMPPLPKAVVRAKADVPALAYEMSSVEKLVLARVSRMPSPTVVIRRFVRARRPPLLRESPPTPPPRPRRSPPLAAPRRRPTKTFLPTQALMWLQLCPKR
jgi:hypothetical protein